MRQDGTDELGAKQQRALEALMIAPSVSPAATTAGVGRSTLYRWLDDPEFVAALNRTRSVRRAAAESALEDLAAESIEAVRSEVSCNANIALSVLQVVDS